MFINKNADIKLVQYIASKYKKITWVFEKSVFTNVTTVDISTNIQIFNFSFVNKIKNAVIDKVYKKSLLVVQVYYDKKKTCINKVINYTTGQPKLHCLPKWYVLKYQKH